MSALNLLLEFAMSLIWVGNIVFAYGLGSLSAAIIVCRFFQLEDPRTSGSENPGATNVLRIGGKLPAILTLLGDMLKGVIPVLIARYAFHLSLFDVAFVGLAAFLGHLFPIFFGFKGGKGVATAFGVLATLSWPICLAIMGIWLAVFSISRISSLAALLSFSATPLLASYFCPDIFLGLSIMSVLLIARHHQNIVNLINGNERKFSKKI
jgi:glycerol-3-phosphate acyltransferase PlsY